MSENVQITFNIEYGPGQTEVMELTKQQYGAVLDLGWKTVEDYKYEISNLKITFEGEIAIVTADIIETSTINGQNIVSNVKEIATVERVNGKLLFTKIYADAKHEVSVSS